MIVFIIKIGRRVYYTTRLTEAIQFANLWGGLIEKRVKWDFIKEPKIQFILSSIL